MISTSRGQPQTGRGSNGHPSSSYCVCPQQDPHLNRFFQQCQKRELDLSLPPTSTFLSCLKVSSKRDPLLLLPLRSAGFDLHVFCPLLPVSLQGLLSMDRLPVIIRFLPVLFNRLFKVLTENDNDEVTTATTR